MINSIPVDGENTELKPKFMTNPPRSVTQMKKLVAVARSIVTYQVGLPVGCIHLRRALLDLGLHKELSYSVLDEYFASVSGLPIGSERLEWNRGSLRESDLKLEAANRNCRDRIFDACYEIIDSYGKESHDSA